MMKSAWNSPKLKSHEISFVHGSLGILQKERQYHYRTLSKITNRLSRQQNVQDKWYFVRCLWRISYIARLRFHWRSNRMRWRSLKWTKNVLVCRLHHHELRDVIPDFNSGVAEQTNWGREKIAAISQMTFSIVFCWMKIYEFRLRFHWSFVHNVRINNNSALVQIMAWRRRGDMPLSEPMMISSLTPICIAWIRAVRHRTAVRHSSYHLLCMLEWSVSGHCSVCINHSAQNFKGWLRTTLDRRHFYLYWYLSSKPYSSFKAAWIFL